jgi:glycosyltransferase involved in cell wall biosynthesis
VRVLVLAPYPLGHAPSQRFRWEQYLEPLRECGIVLEPSCFLDDHGMRVVHRAGAWGEKTRLAVFGGMRRLRDTVNARRYELILVHRESLPLGPAWVERALVALGVPYALDLDDAIYLGDTSAANRRLAWLDNGQRTVSVVERASLVLAGNEHLASWARMHTARVEVVPTTIDTDVYRPVPRGDHGEICIGWTGSMSTIAHLELLVPVLRELQQESRVRIRVIGDSGFQIQGASVEALPWREETEVEDLGPIDIGIMPLPDDEWARGKCGLKALQYMSLGIPTVLSPVGVNVAIAQGGAAVLASTAKEWKEALRSLIGDPGRRVQVGAAGRRRVEESYSVRAMLPAWERALRIAARPARPGG